MTDTIQRIRAVASDAGLSKSTIYSRITQGLWTTPVSLGGRSKGWPSSDGTAINAARIAGKSDDEIRALVVRLHAARKELA